MRVLRVTAVCAAVVLAVSGLFAKPYIHDWTVARHACGGALPGSIVSELTPNGVKLADEESQQIDGLGWYSCSVRTKGERGGKGLLFSTSAYTRRDDLDREFMTALSTTGLFGYRGIYELPQVPAPLPGFLERAGFVDLVVRCPGLGKDDDGRPRKMLVRTQFGYDAHKQAPTVPYRLTVALTNALSDRLGCGAKPLKAPQSAVAMPDDDRHDSGRTVSPAETKGMACSWLATANLPPERRWQAEVRGKANDAAPVHSCTVSAPARAGRDPDKDHLTLAFGAWYGDWSTRLTADEYSGKPYGMMATARCDGEAATYALRMDYDGRLAKDVQRRLLREFAEDQVQRRGCSGLRFRY